MQTWIPLVSPPETWDDPEALPLLEVLLIFGGGTLGIIAVIVLLVLAPSLARGTGHRFGADRWAEPLWFGGPTGALDSGDMHERRQLEQPAGSTPAPSGAPAGPTTGGGAGARW